MRRFALILPLVLAGCGVDTSGLGDDVVVEDSGEDTTISGDETGSLFDADEVSIEDSDSTIEETAAETSAETSTETGDETIAEAGDETGADADIDASDGALEAETELDADLDATPEVAADAVPEVATDSGTDSADSAPTDTGSTSGLVSTPGEISCSHSGTAKSCTGGLCCGTYDLLSLSWKWDCSGSCFAGRGYSCDEKADCTGGKLCCGSYAAFSTTINGSDCRTSCGSDAQLCMTNAECGAKTCTPQKAPDSPHTIGVCK